MYNEYIDFLNDLTHQERSIFLYCFVLKINQKEAAKCLRLSLNFVNKTFQEITSNIKLIGLKEKILKAFLI